MQLKFRIGLGLGFVVLILVIVGIIRNDHQDPDADLRVGIVADNGLFMVSISPLRRMINMVEINPGREVWIPGGMGWYRSDRIKKMLMSEKKENLINRIFWLNYGFDPKAILWKESGEGELSDSEILNTGGLVRWLNYRLQNNNWLLKKEEMGIFDGDEKLDEIMARDMAETRLVNIDSKITVGNLTESAGLANFVSKSLERSGLTVIDNTNTAAEKVLNCLVKTKTESELKEWFVKIFPECQTAVDSQLEEAEVEIYFGEDWAKMINYQSYKK